MISTQPTPVEQKVQDSLATLRSQQVRAVARLRQAYAEGRYQAATPTERATAKRNLGILSSRIRELEAWQAGRRGRTS